MRYISFMNQKPETTWQTNADLLLANLKAAPDSQKRKEIIESNSKVWGDLKGWLLSLSHQKCWFSEAKDCFSHWDVEHFRPKKSAKDADGTEHDCYWWLAFDWRNFRICGNAGNRKKSTYFPLRTGCLRAMKPEDDLRIEEPHLLDPADPDDPNLLSFTFEGRAIPAPDIGHWERERVTYSVERLNLDFPPLMDKRKVVWTECWQRIEEYREELARLSAGDVLNPVARNQLKASARAIRDMMHEEKELSAVARACILSSGDSRVTRLLQSA
jgi:uncharacterized protein (TIGR02646 family)